VGWWVLDRLLQQWHFGRFAREGAALVAQGTHSGHPVRLLKPLTFMNRSGRALLPLLQDPAFVPATDLLVVVDDAALPVGRLRVRARGSPGGHNGLKSIEAVLGSQEYPRLRVGVGEKQPGSDLADHVLAEFTPEEETQIMELLPTVTDAISAWLDQGLESAMRYNR
jgi:PTH1 family peptidyl-tRNA hydrolase